MDEKVAKWIIEYLLRQPIDEKIINDVISCLPLSNDDDSHLKKTILLRKLEFEVANGCVSEKLLEQLEIIEELNHGEKKLASEMMKEAYAAVAVDCTVRFMDENAEENGKYFEAVERVWRNRVCKMKGLSAEETTRWWGDIKANSSVCEKIMMRNTRNEALKAVKVYLKEAWKSLGPSCLELVAEKFGDQVEALRRGEVGGAEGNSCRQLVGIQGTQEGQSMIRRKHVAVKARRHRGAKIAVTDEDDAEEAINTASDVPTHNMDKVQDRLQSNAMQVHAATSDSDVNASRAAHDLSIAKAAGSTSIVNEVANQPGFLTQSTPEISRVQEALKSSSRELHEAVTDPLPEAVQTANTLASTGMAGNHEHAIENQTGEVMHAITQVDRVRQTHETSSELAAVKNVSPDACQTVENVSSKMATNNMRNDDVLEPGNHAHRESPTENNADFVDKNDKVTKDALGNKTHDPTGPQKRKRSLMEPNGTTQTFEWDDSIDNTNNVNGGLRAGPRLPPSPNRSKVSPIQQYEDKKFEYRRERKKWKPPQEDVLREAVKKFGRRWKLIRDTYGDVFEGRTDVDLKDKWRNMTKSLP